MLLFEELLPELSVSELVEDVEGSIPTFFTRANLSEISGALNIGFHDE